MHSIDELGQLLRKRFMGSIELAGLPIRTRSKQAKKMVCQALGLPIPLSFAKTSPRFPAENLDVAVQKSNNFQPWNTELDPSRRYAFLLLDSDNRVFDVRVLSGTEVAKYNTTGTLTSKYQAAFSEFDEPVVRIHGDDTPNVQRLLTFSAHRARTTDPCAPPGPGLLTLQAIGSRLGGLLGSEILDPGADQERLRGQGLHQLVSACLGYGSHRDTGQHPDVPNQLLELKLQTSPTIDLGLVDPSSRAVLSPPFPDYLTHADTRYAVFGGVRSSTGNVRLVGLTLVSGDCFFEVFRRFGGLGVNSKLQIRLPAEWWYAD